MNQLLHHLGIVIAHPPIQPDISEQQVTTFLEPDRAFRRLLR